MTVRFIHSGDWHLGKSFGTLPEGLSGELRAARFDAISRIADIAIDRAASHVLVAGDVFDSPDIARVDLRRAVERMADHPNIVWVLLPGNHDPARSGGVWQRLRRLEPPQNIVIADEAAPLDLAPGVTLLPAPLTSKFPGHDPSAWMTSAVTPPGTLRIGLAHGSVQAFGQGSNGDGGNDGDSGVTLAADRAAQSGLAYLALGDWHGTKRITPNTWYSGTPEPDRFPDNDPGHVLAV
ncbi:MAG: DNA repair exonuclease, partial [Hyphomicrobium sp.]|nr:DNA repair exonuclease [Hyphomicrobium sp.]